MNLIKSKKLKKFKSVNHAFFNKVGGKSEGIYKSLNCGIGSKDSKFKVIQKEYKQNSHPWRFEFLEMSGGKIVTFVYNLENKYDYCNGPNAFYVKKK